MPTILQIDKQSHLTGQTMRTLLESHELNKRGYRVILACQPNSFLERSGRERSLEILRLRMNYFLPSLIKLSFFLRRENVDLINAHGYPDHFLCAIARKLTGVTALVRTKHNHVPLKGGALSRYLYGTLTSRIVAISEHIREVMIRSGLKPGQVTTISTAINLRQFAPRAKDQNLLKELNFPAGCAIIGIVARLTERKGFKNLFEAVKILADQGRTIRCLVVGGGASSEKIAALKNHAVTLGISNNILLTGRRGDIPEILSLLDVFILPSLAEGLGRSMLEAMSAGKPIVASAVGGIPEAIEDGKSGLLVPPDDSRALAQAIALLLDHPEKAQELGRASRLRAEQLFDQNKMIDSICALYEELLNTIRLASTPHS